MVTYNDRQCCVFQTYIGSGGLGSRMGSVCEACHGAPGWPSLTPVGISIWDLVPADRLFHHIFKLYAVCFAHKIGDEKY